jgi:lipopolysaccharide export system permease protein
MTLIERYLFRQLLGPTLWAMAALAALGILSQSLAGLDLIVEQRQSTWVFIKVTALAMPMTLSLVVPLAIFVAGLVTLNRLQTEHEIVVCYAGGVSRWRVLSPALRLAGWATLFTLVINLWVAPWATREMHAEINAARSDLAASLVREGQFTHPVQGLTVYAQSVGAGGIMRNIFINQDDPKTGKSTTYTAHNGRLIKQNGRPMLLMMQGASQDLNKDGALSYLEFAEYTLDLQPYEATVVPKPKETERYMRELIHPSKKDVWAMANKKRLKAEAWSRVGSSLYCLAFMALAVSAVLGGSFNRLGYAKRIAVFCLLAIIVRVIGLILPGLCIKSAGLNPLQVIVPLLTFAGAIMSYIGRRVPRPKQAKRPPAKPAATSQGLAGATA